ncbi:MAG: hypothetical protein WCZ17_03055 [Candidatus Kapaibacterium sp.]|jgi:hypothetical protein
MSDNLNNENLSGVEKYGFDDEDIFSGDGKILENSSSKTDIDESNSTANIEPSSLDNPLLNANDLVDVIQSSNKATANTLKSPVLHSGNLIKSDSNGKNRVLSPIDFQKEIEKSVGGGKIDWSAIAEEPENDILSDEFLDFVEFPLISGDKKTTTGKNLISSDDLKPTKRKVEITDSSDPINEDHQTSVEINRNENGEIESLAVYCKCGELTQINFNYMDDNNTLANKEYFKSDSSIKPVNFEEVKLKK